MDFSHVEWNYSYVTNHAEGAKLGHSGCRLASAGWHAAPPPPHTHTPPPRKERQGRGRQGAKAIIKTQIPTKRFGTSYRSYWLENYLLQLDENRGSSNCLFKILISEIFQSAPNDPQSELKETNMKFTPCTYKLLRISSPKYSSVSFYDQLFPRYCTVKV